MRGAKHGLRGRASACEADAGISGCCLALSYYIAEGCGCEMAALSTSGHTAPMHISESEIALAGGRILNFFCATRNVTDVTGETAFPSS